MPIDNDDSTSNSFSPIPSTTDADANAPVIPSALSPEAQLKLVAIESLREVENQQAYATRLNEAAVELNIPKRTMRRIVEKWRQDGV